MYSVSNGGFFNVRFRLCYFDMSGTLLDYKDYYKTDIDIAPSMTKQVDIPAFEARRNYSYYKSNSLYEDRRFNISFKLLGYNESYIDQKTEKGLNDSIYEDVEQMPSFPGGQWALMQYLANNIKYPVVAQENGIEGHVVVSFVVERDGSITDVQVVRSVDPSLDREALRVVRSMPKWIPGKQKGQAVRVKYNMPVSFRL
ncbi:hypothetical protein PRLR5107_28710 [Prevotella lacticifex]|uniref:TonB C-terminal domain-containing protein n=1 Tax=Prevotella lacticifex TaxID=2854755 RepID=A0A9R1C8J8_9BACT|nr:hypothetical protein PRLR5003_27540 [Prevotella lacticifex]GJG41058.1 hypothetical protein PRLR5019_30290 [Prevotella lacticifex]GJG47252.1 hypothetical protein PRLR5027_28470 [Prevotella lacticifex]GJG53589.1 hypothetical protein PRLR5064_28110 [Prevotella lacticifex]GJG57977.1 hypothetical protein PRLR5076_08280 [Prevotella lacticifex]